MKSLFLKIFLSFWVAQALFLVTAILLMLFFVRNAIPPGKRCARPLLPKPSVLMSRVVRRRPKRTSKTCR